LPCLFETLKAFAVFIDGTDLYLLYASLSIPLAQCNILLYQ
jgi:hypothetical protein